ncbi:MAG: SDR family oxidoreductase [Steroidobacteraceae bacterium]
MARGMAAVTGASSGIGAVFARRLAATHDLLLIARRIDRLEALAAELRRQQGALVEILPADLTDPAQLLSVEQRIAGEGRLALLVNNAGFGTRGQFWQASIDTQAQMHQLNVVAVLRLSHAALRTMVPRQSGALINIGSVAGFMRRAGSASYGATKAWVVAFTEALHLEMRRIGSPVKVQALCPGFTLTEFHDAMNIERERIAARPYWLQAEHVVEESLKALPSGRLFVIPGWRYKLIVNLISTVPLPLRLAIETRVSRKH